MQLYHANQLSDPMWHLLAINFLNTFACDLMKICHFLTFRDRHDEKIDANIHQNHRTSIYAVPLFPVEIEVALPIAFDASDRDLCNSETYKN